MKKITIIFSMLLSVVILMCFVLNTNAASVIKVSSSSVTQNYVDGTFTVPIKFSNVYKGINNLNFAIKCDPNYVVFVKATAGSIIPDKSGFKASSSQDGRIVVKYVSPDQNTSGLITKDGTFTTITFSPKKRGITSLNVFPKSDTRFGYDFADINLKALSVSFNLGGITIN